jgi:hypothetical protein
MVRAGLIIALAGVVLAVLGSTPCLLMGVLTPEEEATTAFDVLMVIGWGLGGVLLSCGMLVAALGAVFRPLSAAPLAPRQ